MHRLFRDAARDGEIYRQAATAFNVLRDLPVVTVFGAWSDYLRFQPKWRARIPQVKQERIPRGVHFPMCDNPTAVAAIIRRSAE